VFSDRFFNSVLSITKPAIFIQGTRFGTVKELKASEAFVHLNKLGETLDIKELDWLASVAASAEETLLKIGGGIVSCLFVMPLLCLLKEKYCI
jgi:hypothetical protein